MAVIQATLDSAGLEITLPRDNVVAFAVPGEHKLATPCQFVVGDHAVAVHAFVCRNPDENHETVYRWLLSRNLKFYGVAFGLDHNADIYLNGRLALDAVTETEVDRLLGSVLAYADESFDTLLELGFATSIRKEWKWRRSRGEPTGNLDAFRSWLERDAEQ
ncbi:MAG: YbjN domain-containing protein [Nocardioidaceae bacterium]